MILNSPSIMPKLEGRKQVGTIMTFFIIIYLLRALEFRRSVRRCCSLDCFGMGAVGRRWFREEGFYFFAGLRQWWIRRQFKLILEDESVVFQARTRRQTKANNKTFWSSDYLPCSCKLGSDREERRVQIFFLPSRNSSDSCDESVESIDSLDGSYSSQSTSAKSHLKRLHRQDRFFAEHLNFLIVQTQPREVEVFYNS